MAAMAMHHSVVDHHLASRERGIDYDPHHHDYRPTLTAEQWLWLAQIDAVRYILQMGPRRRRPGPIEYEEARRWVISRAQYVGSFEFVCGLFPDFDAQAIREKLLAIRSGGKVRKNTQQGVRPSWRSRAQPNEGSIRPRQRHLSAYSPRSTGAPLGAL
jgi:hypothetical protein